MLRQQAPSLHASLCPANAPLRLSGNFNNQADKILFPLLFEDSHYANAQLGIYGACYKLAVVMVLFTQAFRYAYDPFIFAEKKKG